MPGLQKQVARLQRHMDDIALGRRQELQAFLRRHASAEHPGAPVTVLQTARFLDANGKVAVQLDAAVVAGDTLYVGQWVMDQGLGEDAVAGMAAKVEQLRRVLTAGPSPDTAAALQGVSQLKLFLGGEAVREGLTVEDLVELAAEEGVSVVLRTGQSVVGGAVPAVDL
ncbi:hypothetical protein ABPG75_010506 [Micractinium tetrahymenae]